MELKKLTPFAAIFLAACTSAPDFRTAGVDYDNSAYAGQIPVGAIVDHIACELYKADAAHGNELSSESYAAVATLNLKVDDNGGVAPSLNFIHPFITPMNSVTYALGGQLNEARERTYSQTFAFNIPEISKTPAKGGCSLDEVAWGINLTGDLKIKEAIDMGLSSIPSPDTKGSDSSRWMVEPLTLGNTSSFTAYPTTTTTTSAAGQPTSPILDHPAFGTTIQFVLTKGINGGPTWTLTSFKGPGGMSPLASYSRMDTQQIIIALSPPGRKLVTLTKKELSLMSPEDQRHFSTKNKFESAVSSALGVLNNLQIQEIKPNP
jgi:hypothetical protein